jgi:hypothetical protein
VRRLGPAALVLALASIFFGPRIYWDRTLLVGDGFYYVDPSFRAAVPPGTYATKPRNFLTHVDNGLQMYPQMEYVQASLSRGEVPWWNPYLALGVPGVAITGAVFEPFMLVLGRLFDAPLLSNVKAVVGMAVGGAGMAVFVRALGASRTAGVLAAVAFAFSGWTIAWLGRTNMLAEMWLPWLFWATERLLSGGGARFVGALAVFTGFTCLSSHPQTAVHMLAGLAVYAAWRALRGMALLPAARRLLLVGLALALGLTIGLVQLLPTAELIADSELPAQGRARTERAAGIAQAVWYGVRGDWTVIRRDVPTALMLVSPLYFGSPANSTWWWRGYNMMEMMVYAGLLPLFFAVYAAARRREVPVARVWLVFAVVSLAIAYALPVFNLANYLPVIGLANNGRLRLVFRFALVVAAAFGFDRFMGDLRTGRGRWAAWLGGFALVALVAPALARPVIAASGTQPRLWPLGAALWAEVGVVVLLVALAVAAALRARRVVGAGALRIAVVALAFTDMWWHLGDFNPALPREHVFPETPAVRVIRSDPALFRVTSALPLRIMPADSKLPYRLYDTDLFDVLNMKRYTQLQQTVNGFPWGPDNTIRAFMLDPGKHRGLMNLMNVKYTIAPGADFNLPSAYEGRTDFRKIYDRDVRIWENIEVLPRAFVVGAARIVSAEQALVDVTSASFDPRAAVLLEDPASPKLAGPGSGRAVLAAYDANRVVVRTDTAAPAYLVLADTYHPGWRARLDGTDATIYRANFLFRAVHLPAGAHEVVFEFAPPSYRLAVVGSLLAVAIAGACLAFGPTGSRARRA